MEDIISKFNTTVEILKSSATYNFAWQKSFAGPGAVDLTSIDLNC